MRKRNFRVIRVLLECGCQSDLHTGRYRVSKDLAAILFGGAIRRGVWCPKHPGMGQPKRMLGVFSM